MGEVVERPFTGRCPVCQKAARTVDALPITWEAKGYGDDGRERYCYRIDVCSEGCAMKLDDGAAKYMPVPTVRLDGSSGLS